MRRVDERWRTIRKSRSNPPGCVNIPAGCYEIATNIAATNHQLKALWQGRRLKRVLITRPEPGATETAARLIELGYEPICAPVLAIEPGNLVPTDHVAATLLTSRNAVPACSPILYRFPAFAVGPATAAAALKAGFRKVFNADGDATNLATMLADLLSPASGTLFLPVGQGQGRDLAVALRQRGFRVLRRVAYRAVALNILPELAVTFLRERPQGMALFFSQETSRQFVHLIRAYELADTVSNLDAVSISERAAVALTPLRWRRIIIAAKPNQDAMLALLEHD